MAPPSFSTNVGLYELDTFCHVYQKIGVEVDGTHLYCTYHMCFYAFTSVYSHFIYFNRQTIHCWQILERLYYLYLTGL